MMSLLRKTLVASLVLGGVAACDSPTATGVPEGAVALNIEQVSAEIAQYLYSGIDDRRRLYVQNDAEWAALWAEVTEPYHPPPPVPAINFATHSVIVAAMGTRPSGGYTITIDSVFEGSGQLHAIVRETSPASNCVVTAALTAPVHAVLVPKRTGSVAFIERTETLYC